MVGNRGERGRNPRPPETSSIGCTVTGELSVREPYVIYDDRRTIFMDTERFSKETQGVTKVNVRPVRLS